MRLRSPAAERNVGPIARVLTEWLPESGLVLEIASGSGEHAVAFAHRFPDLEWQPSDPDEEALRSIAAAQDEEGASNLHQPLRIDVREPDWGVEAADVVLAVNMVHIAPWSASIGLLEGAAALLPPSGRLILYGPWLVDGEPTAPSNLAFDADLRRRNPAWGLRRVSDFAAEADLRGFDLSDQRAMPANNRVLLFRKR